MKPDIRASSEEVYLQQEAGYLRELPTGIGIQYDINRHDSIFDRIQFINDENDGIKIEVTTEGPDQLPVKRWPTISEAFQFMLVATYALPGSRLVTRLCEFVKFQAEALENAASIHIYNNSLYNIPLTSLLQKTAGLPETDGLW